MKQVIASLGGGFTSTAWLPRILLKTHNKDELFFVTCVLPNEHPDMFKLYDAVEKRLDIKIHYIAYDKKSKWKFVDQKDRQNKSLLYSPLKIFFEQKFLGNSRLDVCSRMLKRETMYNFASTYFHEKPMMALGIHGDEIERIISIKENWESKGYKIITPLINYPVPSKEIQMRLMQRWYETSLELYELGFEHNNCHGACIKAGQRQWALLYYYYPKIYSEWEDGEQLVLQEIGDFSRGILKRQIKGKTEYWTLKKFREWLDIELASDKDTYLTRFINDLPRTPPCTWCSAI